MYMYIYIYITYVIIIYIASAYYLSLELVIMEIWKSIYLIRCISLCISQSHTMMINKVYQVQYFVRFERFFLALVS